MAKNDMFKLGAILVIAWLAFGQNAGTGGTTGGTTTTTPSTVTCGVEPTFTLTGADMYDEDVSVSVSHLYRKNGAAVQTYSSAVTAKVGDKIDVLWGNGNATIYNAAKSYTVEDCGLNDFQYRDLVQNTTVTISCEDEDGVKIAVPTANYTIGSGEAATIPCKLKLDTAKKGIPYGGVMVVELVSGATYDEGLTELSGSIVGSKVEVPTQIHTLNAAANAAKAWEIDPIMESGFHTFDLYVKAEDGQNPGNTNDIRLTLYTNNCYDDGEAGDFKCGLFDEDDSSVGYTQAVYTLQVD